MSPLAHIEPAAARGNVLLEAFRVGQGTVEKRLLVRRGEVSQKFHVTADLLN